MRLPCLSLGHRAERRAARLLRRSGLRVVGRNLRAGGGEIDLLAREGATIVVVEVRERAGGLLAADLSIDRAKEQNLRRAFGALRARFRIPAGTAVRFDLVLLGGDADPIHLRGVFAGES